ncbi:MAG: hypothetical protein B7733_08515 [Myxococcales bacterium FL481]|nr:MAG: hypothetical protein B7733_08515 [Myxococcales bacterium FL481]
MSDMHDLPRQRHVRHCLLHHSDNLDPLEGAICPSCGNAPREHDEYGRGILTKRGTHYSQMKQQWAAKDAEKAARALEAAYLLLPEADPLADELMVLEAKLDGIVARISAHVALTRAALAQRTKDYDAAEVAALRAGVEMRLQGQANERGSNV